MAILNKLSRSINQANGSQGMNTCKCASGISTLYFFARILSNQPPQHLGRHLRHQDQLS